MTKTELKPGVKYPLIKGPRNCKLMTSLFSFGAEEPSRFLVVSPGGGQVWVSVKLIIVKNLEPEHGGKEFWEFNGALCESLGENPEGAAVHVTNYNSRACTGNLRIVK